MRIRKTNNNLQDSIDAIMGADKLEYVGYKNTIAFVVNDLITRVEQLENKVKKLEKMNSA